MPTEVAGLAVGGLGAIGANQEEKKYNKAEGKRIAQILAKLDEERARQGVYAGQAEASVRSALPIQRKAYQDAQANLALMADRQRRTLLAQEKPAQARAAGQVFRAGGIGSNVGGLVSRGVRGDTTRAMQQLDDMFAQHFSQLGIGSANAQSQLYDTIARIKQGAGAASLDLGNSAASAVGSKKTHIGGGTVGTLNAFGKAGAGFLNAGGGVY